MVEIEQVGQSLRLVNGHQLHYAPPGWGRHNSLIVDTIELFGPCYAPNALILYLQDQDNHISIDEQKWIEKLGIRPLEMRLPDILLYNKEENTLVLIEILTSHGPIVQERKREMEEMLQKCSVRRMYVSAMFDLLDYKKVIDDIAWDSYVWMAHLPEHIIHYE